MRPAADKLFSAPVVYPVPVSQKETTDKKWFYSVFFQIREPKISDNTSRTRKM